MRYRETGELHPDFHGATYATINYLIANYGLDSLCTVMERVGTEVYQDIHQHLKAGDSGELRDFKHYFLEREGGKFTMNEHADGTFELIVAECPAVKRIKELGLPFTADFCRQTELLNDALCSGTPFRMTTEKTGEGSCRQTLIRRRDDR